MFKRFFLAAIFSWLLSPLPAFAAGTIPLSLSQRFDNISHLPLAGGQLFFIQAGTTSTPQNAFQDSALTLPYPNPLTLDTGGNIPQLFFADGQIKIRMANASGVTQLSVDNIQVVGASSGGGGGGTVDPTTVFQTGQIMSFYGTGVVTGFVRLNGRTIGSASSGATERANADTQALFQYLWATDVNLPVSTGRGVSANADWVANKQLTLPDARDRALAGLGDMGNSDAGRYTSTYFGPTALNAAGNNCAPTSLGCAAGGESQTLGAGQIPSINVSTSGTLGVLGTANSSLVFLTSNSQSSSFSAVSGPFVGFAMAQGVTVLTQSAQASGTLTGASTNTAGNPHPIVSPVLLITIYQKL